VLGLSGRNEFARLVDDDLSAGDLRRVRECRLESLLVHPVGRDAGRFLGVSCGVEEADGADDAVTGIDQVVAVEAR